MIDIENLSCFSNMESLSLKNVNLEKNILSSLNNLEFLKMTEVDIRSKTFSSLSKLRELIIERSDFGNSPTDVFSGLSNLETLKNYAITKVI